MGKKLDELQEWLENTDNPELTTWWSGYRAAVADVLYHIKWMKGEEE